MNDNRIVFIGAGNMAASLIGGLVKDGYAADRITAVDIDDAKLEALQGRFGIHTSSEAAVAAAKGDVVVLAVKPQMMKEVAAGLHAALTHKPLVLSVAAGIPLAALQGWLGELPLVRTMPNTPALVQSGATALVANDRVSEAQRGVAESIMRAVGLTLWLDDESQMDAVTALSGSGPAYFFLVMEAMDRAAKALGLPAQAARLLTLQTAMGAAKLALESEETPEVLRQKVTSPGGTTEAALTVLMEGDLLPLFEQAMTAAAERSRQLAQEFGAD